MKQNHSSKMAFKISGLFSGSAPSRITAVLYNFLFPPVVDIQVPIWPVVLQRCLFWNVNIINLLIKCAYPPVL